MNVEKINFGRWPIIKSKKNLDAFPIYRQVCRYGNTGDDKVFLKIVEHIDSTIGQDSKVRSGSIFHRMQERIADNRAKKHEIESLMAIYEKIKFGAPLTLSEHDYFNSRVWAHSAWINL